MDRLQAMEVFVRVVETGSFTRTAASLHLPRATVSTLIQQLERHLGIKLLNRTTRRVSVTADGLAYYERCGRILGEVAEAETAVSESRLNPRGRLRVDVGATFGRRLVVPALPEFFARYPDIRLELGCSDRPVDMLEEAVDCVVRGGPLVDASAVARPLGQVGLICCAAPAYLARHGTPRHPHDLADHHIVNYFARRFGEFFVWNFSRGQERVEVRRESRIAVNDSEAYLEAGYAGLGLIQMAGFMIEDALADGRLVRVLDDWRIDSVPIYVIYPSNRQLSAKVQVFVEWLSRLIEAHTRSDAVSA
jgi:LysR family transcriptional regulator for bpeEF and oprC